MNPAFKLQNIPSLGHGVVFVPREQLRCKPDTKRMVAPHFGAVPIPDFPLPINYTKGNSIALPILGNDQVGDCFYAAAAHAVQVWAANAGTPVTFNTQQVIARYEAISGGDNGLSDSDIFPEWIKGIVGPNGPHKILDWMTVNVNDDAAINVALGNFGGLLYTAALPDAWVSDPRPGDTWDAAAPDQQNGHAMFLPARNTDLSFVDETWGFNPPIKLTKAGMLGSDPELIVTFSLEHFTAAGVSLFTGKSYADMAALWVACGGKALPPSPFGPPPPPPPGPTPTALISLATALHVVDTRMASLAAKNPYYSAMLKQIDGLLDGDFRAAFASAEVPMLVE